MFDAKKNVGIVEEERNNKVDRRQEEWEGQSGELIPKKAG